MHEHSASNSHALLIAELAKYRNLLRDVVEDAESYIDALDPYTLTALKESLDKANEALG